MKKLLFALPLIYILFLNTQQILSNNIQVTNATLTGQNTSSGYTYVQFTLTWDDSWRDNVNWDAAWVFVKYKASYDTLWKHGSLNTTAANHNIPGGYTGYPTTDGVGIFIHRSSNGDGSVSLTNVQLRWEYRANGVNDGDLVSIKVFAIEMVYVPQGSFYAGDGSTDNVEAQFSAGNTTSPFLITSESSLTLGGTALTNLGNRNAQAMYSADDFNNTTTQTLPAAFPKGYNAFYCMKYDVSQQQYTEFLNTLTRWKQRSRVQSDISHDTVTNYYVMSNSNTLQYRNRITCPQYGNGTTAPIVFSCDRPDRGCNYLCWMDNCAYLDWAGLRPMTELEYEKACRGPLTPVPDEYAWGNTTWMYCSFMSGTENGTEYITLPSGANCNFFDFNLVGGDGGSGPFRCGIFARNNTTRTLSGATFYGILDMTGGVMKQCASVGNSTARGFTGSHGDGMLSVNGNATNSDWPGNFSGEVTGSNGSGERTRNVSNPAFGQRLSDRYYSNYWTTSRDAGLGIRGVRTIPVGSMEPSQNNKRNNK